MDNKKEHVTFKFTGDIAEGTSAKLRISFKGEINSKLAGFYRAVYEDPSGNKKVMAVTQFEATDARRAFPCWDEPDKKAKFTISLQ
ncbi:puromycin-sensitive aminopeptidase, partial [Mitosporidium daphniae]